MYRLLLSALLILSLVSLGVGVAGAAPSDPQQDTVGWERGYWYNESLDVGDEVSDAELDAVTGRAMARVEFLRQREFTRNVSVRKKTREEIGDEDRAGEKTRNGNVTDSSSNGNANNASDWNNQVWEALFVVNESANVTKQIGGTTKQAVGGYYSGGNISVITSDGGVNELTVAHELVHALQDQRYNMSASRFSPPVQDQQLAEMGLVEGESEYIRALYERKCRSDWNCVRESGGAGVPSAGSGRGNDFNIGILMTIYQPYADGPAYIHSVVENEGWDAVDAKFEGNVPKTSEAIIHIQEDRRVNMTFNDTSNANWSLYPDQGIKGYDVAGEASIYAMFWYQTTRTGESFVDVTSFRNPEHGSFDRLNYTGVPSEGWGNDRIYPYRRVGEDAENQSQADGGYVWKTVWDTEEDAREFQSTYLDLLRTKGAEKVRETVWRIPEGGFEDAFRVVRRNATVTVVNGPTVGSLDAIRPVSNSSSEPPRGNRSDGFGFLLPLGAFAVLALFVLLRRGD